MLIHKANKTKDLLMIGIIIIIIIIVAALILKNFIFTGSAEKGTDDSAIANADPVIMANPDLLKAAAKTLNAEILKTDKYQSLVDNSVRIKSIDELKVGNPNPFRAEKK